MRRTYLYHGLLLSVLFLAQGLEAAVYRPFPLGNTDNVTGLIAVINQANSTSADDIIDLGGENYTLTGAGGTNPTFTDLDLGTSGLPPILGTGGKLSIINGSIERSRVVGTPTFRLIYVNAGANLTLFNITLENGNIGNGDGSGSAIHNSGLLELEDSLISNNISSLSLSSIFGVAIHNDNLGIISVIQNCIIADNSVTPFGEVGSGGAGIYNGNIIDTINNTSFFNNNIIVTTSVDGSGGAIFNNGTINNITNSTFSNNSITSSSSIHGRGAAIFNGSQINNIINSTIANNTIAGVNNMAEGGGIYNDGTIVNLINSTISGNSVSSDSTPGAAQGGGIYNDDTIINLVSDIVANNTAGAGPGNGPDLFNTDTIVNASYDLITSTDSNNIVDGVNHNIVVSVPNLFLGPLQNNGGPTYTMALLPGSLAINNGINDIAKAKTDQRGFPRPSGSMTDIGAYEFQQ